MTASPRLRQSALALLVSLLIALTVGLALPGFSSPAAAQNDALTVHDQSVEIDFPAQITFNIDVDAPEPIERLELRYQPMFSEVSRAERPGFDSGSAVSTSYDLDLRTNYLPPGIDIEYRWIATLESGEQLETDTEEFFFIDNRYDWQERADGPVSIYYYDGGSGFGDLAMDVTNRTIDDFGSDFDVELEEPINIVLYGSVSDFQEALPYNSPEWIGGFADPSQNLIVAGISPDEGATTEMGRMLAHEVVHLMVAQATLNPFNGAPRWLDEGLAINYQTFQEDRFRRILDQAVEQGQLIPLPALRSSFPSDSDLAVQSYAQSESVVSFMIEEYGHDSIAAILDVYREGVSHGDAVQHAMGVTLEEIDEQWRAWLGYDGDVATSEGNESATPGAGERIEDVLTTVGVMPVLVVGGMVVVVLGLVRMVRAINFRELDEDVGPEVEYYGQDMFDDEDADVIEDDPFTDDDPPRGTPPTLT